MDKDLAKLRKQKRWSVFSKAHKIETTSRSTSVNLYDTVYARDSSSPPNYTALNDESRPAYFLEFTDDSFDKCKEVALELMKQIGTENVIIVRNVDADTVLYPVE